MDKNTDFVEYPRKQSLKCVAQKTTGQSEERLMNIN